MDAEPHRIRRQSWLVRTRSAAEGFRVRAELRGAWESVLLPALEEAFDAVGTDRVLHIPRLELHLRLDAPEELASQLPRMIRDGIADRLAARDADEIGRERRQSADEGRGETLLHYLRTGELPWPAAGGLREETAARLRATCAVQREAVLRTIRTAAQPDAVAFRYLQLLDEALARELVTALTGPAPPLARRALLALLVPSEGAGQPSAPRHHRLEAASMLLGSLLARTRADTPAALREIVARGADPARSALEWLLPTHSPRRGGAGGRHHGGGGGDPPRQGEAPSPPTGPRSVPVDAPAEPPAIPSRPASTRRRRRGRAAGRPEAAGAAPRPRADRDPLPSDLDGWPEGPERASGDAGFGAIVANAGLVLLHPFLPTLLREAGLSRRGPIPAEGLPRAAALLHYLATGSDEPLEWELGLLKVLLGCDADAPLPVAGGLLGDADRAEADGLLDAVIGHWSVLRSTSREGLRSAFLQRPGLLRAAEEGWRLSVEPAPYDLLLAHLPWAISVFRTPWMPQPMQVEWQAP